MFEKAKINEKETRDCHFNALCGRFWFQRSRVQIRQLLLNNLSFCNCLQKIKKKSPGVGHFNEKMINEPDLKPDLNCFSLPTPKLILDYVKRMRLKLLKRRNLRTKVQTHSRAMQSTKTQWASECFTTILHRLLCQPRFKFLV